MNDDDRPLQYNQEVYLAVGKLIARAWIDQEFQRELILSPRRALLEVGCDFPERYAIQFIPDSRAELGEWESIGKFPAAIHIFKIPPRPADLDWAADDISSAAAALACCSPCCCTGAAASDTWD